MSAKRAPDVVVVVPEGAIFSAPLFFLSVLLPFLAVVVVVLALPEGMWILSPLMTTHWLWAPLEALLPAVS